MNFLFRSIAALCWTLVLGGAAGQADPLAELAAVSSIRDVNLDKLAGGTVMVGRGPVMNSSRSLAVESVYVVRKPMAKAADFHVQWNGSKHSELKIFLHGEVSPHPVLSDFQKLSAAPASGSVKNFALETQKLGSGATALQLSNAEVKAFASQAAGSGDGGLGPKVSAFWSQTLSQRAQAFATGGAAHLPPYETLGESVRATDEIAHLLKDAPKVRAQFASLIENNPLTGSKTAVARENYWEMFDVEGEAAISLGATYQRPNGESIQAVDGAYYATSGYYVLLSFYQFWPVKVGGHDCTLVWRADLVSAPSLASLRGVERLGSSTAMMRETKKNIEDLLQDAAQAP